MSPLRPGFPRPFQSPSAPHPFPPLRSSPSSSSPTALSSPPRPLPLPDPPVPPTTPSSTARACSTRTPSTCFAHWEIASRNRTSRVRSGKRDEEGSEAWRNSRVPRSRSFDELEQRQRVGSRRSEGLTEGREGSGRSRGRGGQCLVERRR
jgi:hypothetical protein